MREQVQVPNSACISVVHLNTSLTLITHATSIASQYPLIQNSQKIMRNTQLVILYWEQGLEVPFEYQQALQMYASVENLIIEPFFFRVYVRLFPEGSLKL